MIPTSSLTVRSADATTGLPARVRDWHIDAWLGIPDLENLLRQIVDMIMSNVEA
jgi:hypothetical protein